MYVKFLFNPKDRDRDTVSESVFECDSYNFDYQKDDPYSGCFLLYKQNNHSMICMPPVNIDLELTSVYIMGSSGKTIDNFSWKKDRENNRCIRM